MLVSGVSEKDFEFIPSTMLQNDLLGSRVNNVNIICL